VEHWWCLRFGSVERAKNTLFSSESVFRRRKSTFMLGAEDDARVIFEHLALVSVSRGFSMARIPYPDVSRYERGLLVERIKRERGGKLLNLYRMLLHSPPVAEGWLTFFTAVRQSTDLPGRYRELAILRIAVLNGADYEFNAHAPFAVREGVSQAVIEDLRASRMPVGLADADRAVLAYADSMTRDVHVPDDVFAHVREHLTERDVVELTATIAAYNCVSRFLEALRIDEEAV
jgi:alkylhydroperoxidase family enzyme